MVATHPDHTVALHHRDLNVLRSSLHDLEQRLDRQLDRLIALEVLRVVLLQELPDRLGRTTDGACLWCQRSNFIITVTSSGSCALSVPDILDAVSGSPHCVHGYCRKPGLTFHAE